MFCTRIFQHSCLFAIFYIIEFQVMYDYLVVMKYSNILTNVFLPGIVLTLIENVWGKKKFAECWKV